MQATVRITRTKLVGTDTEAINLADLDPTDDLVWEGPGKLGSSSSAVFAVVTEGQSLAVQQLVLSIPATAVAVLPDGFRADDMAHIVDGGPDLAATGQDFRIAAVPFRTRATARRFPVEHQEARV